MMTQFGKLALELAGLTFNYYSKHSSMERDVALCLSQLYHNKHPSLQQIVALVHALYRGKKEGSLAQRMSAIASAANFILNATKAWLETVSKLKKEICYDPFLPDRQKKLKRPSTAKKNRQQEGRSKRKELTLDQMLAQAVQNTLSHSNSPQIITPRRYPTIQQNNLTTALPPLPAELIQMINKDESTIIHNSSRSQELHNPTMAEKMQTYRKLLQGTLPDADATLNNRTSLNSTRRRRSSTKRREKLVRDEQIDLNQGTLKIQMIQQLSTKVKMAREHEGGVFDSDSFENRMKQLNPVLRNTKQMRLKLAEKIKESKLDEHQSMYQNNQIHIEQQSGVSLHASLESKFVLGQQDNPTVAAALQAKLTSILQSELFIESKIGFHQFCRKRKINKQIKGELFYQLLHMDFPLHQPHSSQFGEIFITPK